MKKEPSALGPDQTLQREGEAGQRVAPRCGAWVPEWRIELPLIDTMKRKVQIKTFIQDKGASGCLKNLEVLRWMHPSEHRCEPQGGPTRHGS